MIRRQPLATLVAIAALALIFLPPLQALSATIVAPSFLPSAIATDSVPLPIDPSVQAIWETADGSVLRGEIERGWLWGPAPIAMATERYAGSPTGARTMVYFDKGRLDLNDPTGPADSPWHVTGAQLVTEMLAGAIQLGANDWVQREPARMPVAGDPNQVNTVTYETFGRVATLPGPARRDGASNTAARRVGEPITALLLPDGRIEPAEALPADVLIGRHDEATGHNIAQPFVEWENAQPFPSIYLLGHALTEPYWIDSMVSGERQRVMVQTFERRVLTYTPSNDPGWRVESGNVGQHYRAWRGLTRPADNTLTPLAAFVPFGEEIAAAASNHGVDPWLLAALAKVASNSNPLAERGLFAQRGEPADDIHDPGAAADSAAEKLADLTANGADPRAALAGWGDGDEAARATFADSVLAERDRLRSSWSSQMTVAAVDAQTSSPSFAGSVPATVIPARYDRAWWERSLVWHEALGDALDGWQFDSAGNYCVGVDYAPGDRLRLFANGVSIDCAIGARAGEIPLLNDAAGRLALSQQAFDALGLSVGDSVEVYQVGPGSTGGSATRFASGGAAFYDPDYDRGWWDWVIGYHASGGRAVAGWSVDPNGFYCVHPDFIPGQRLRLVANGVTLDCTIGDAVAGHDVATWRSRWAVELSWSSFEALGLDANNWVEVYRIE